MWEIRVEAFPPPHRYPASCASTVIDSFQLGSSKGPPGWWAMETELGSEAKESILWLKNGEVGAQALESRLSWRGRAPGCFLGVLAVGEGAGAKFCAALHSPDLSARHSVSAHGPLPAPSWTELSCPALLHTLLELRCQFGHFGRNSVGSEVLGTAVVCWDSSSDVLGTRLLHTALTGK